MRPADRLFQIIQILRRSRHPMTAKVIAAEIETSKRTVYRDIATLIAQRIPIRGEAGFGYVLEGGFDLPPLMLSSLEIEAAALGAQWVSQRGDPELARAAEDLIAKIAAIVPEPLRAYALDPVGRAPPAWEQASDAIDMAKVRTAIHAGRKIRMAYGDERGEISERTVWPVAIGYFDSVRHLVAWCETRRDFRSFRTDRVRAADFLDERYPERPAQLRARWRKTLTA